MICKKCGSENVKIDIVTETKLKNKSKGIIYWLLIGWWLEILLWLFLTVPRLFVALFMPKRQKIVTINKKVALCQDCGHYWKI